jgi:hypothetical protein
LNDLGGGGVDPETICGDTNALAHGQSVRLRAPPGSPVRSTRSHRVLIKAHTSSCWL